MNDRTRKFHNPSSISRMVAPHSSLSKANRPESVKTV
jgi:hypothetical protein